MTAGHPLVRANELTATQALRLMRSGDLSVEALAQACLERIRRRSSQSDHSMEIAARRQRSGDFRPGGGIPGTPTIDVRLLYAKIRELTLEDDFLEGALIKGGLLSAKR